MTPAEALEAAMRGIDRVNPDDAEIILAALAAAGFVVVPVVATGSMTLASGLTGREASTLWQAMLAARPR
jgi:hypothetical protein